MEAVLGNEIGAISRAKLRLVIAETGIKVGTKEGNWNVPEGRDDVVSIGEIPEPVG